MAKAKNSESGFTLIEILIVIGIVALVTSMGVGGLSNVFRQSAEAFTRQTALLLRQARDRAMLTDKIIRLRIDLDAQEFWLEETSGGYLLPKVSDRVSDRKEEEEKAKTQSEAFHMVKELTSEKRKVAKSLRITEVITPRQKDPVKAGMVDVYFFNNGNADGVTIRFESDEKTGQVITLHPLTGQSKIVSEAVKQ